jgi:hypothetical protein
LTSKLKSTGQPASDQTEATEAPPENQCPNCGAALYGQFCFACGQNQKAVDRHFITLVSEFLEDVFTPNSRTARTLSAVLFRPGFLTREYFCGRKAKYIQPIRLYLTMSILFFFLVSLSVSAPEIQPQISAGEEPNISVDTSWTGLSEEDTQHLNQRLTEQIAKATRLLKEDPDRVRDIAIDNAPPVIFCLVPMFALILKLAYLNQRRFYTEHLVLALHNHSFLFFALLLETLIDLVASGNIKEWLEIPIDAWIPIYLLLSLKVYYAEGWFVTFVKFSILAISYWSLFLVVAMSAALVGVMSL